MADTRVLRAHLHETLIKIGRKAATTPVRTEAPTAAVTTPTVTAEKVTPVQLVPMAGTTIPHRFWFTDCGKLLRWIQSVSDPDNEPRIISWFRLNILCEADLNTKGVFHHLKQRQWSSVGGLPVVVFATRTNLLAGYIRCVTEAAGGLVKPAQLRPDYGIIQFWTQCVAIRLPYAAWARAENLFRDQQVQLSSVRELRNLV